VTVVVDTSVLIDAERSRRPVDRLVGTESMFINVITMSEMLRGVHHTTDLDLRERRRASVEPLLLRFEPLDVTARVARSHAVVWAQLARAGTPIGVHDLWIAATALAHDFRVMTGNVREFSRVPGLEVVAI
jgi:tRNA(fMet)-specific endonuclease VapC